MKLCNVCEISKPITEFHLSPSHADGRMKICKKCRNIKYNKANFSLIIRKIYFMQVHNSKQRGHSAPSYDAKQLLEWALKQPSQKSIWDNYVNSDYKSELKPSIDRKNPNKGYSLNNIQLMTWKENRAKGGQDKKNNIQLDRHRPVVAYHLDGSFYKKFHSVSEAARHVNGFDTSIRRVANGVPVSTGRGRYTVPKQHRGFIWKWTTP